MRKTWILLVVLSTLAVFPLQAEAKRVALVVGNSAYDGPAALKNPVNDAKDVAATLKRIGWNVIEVTEADRRSFNRAVISFRDTLALEEGSQALFYYAGHGMQVDGANYLIPVKTPFDTIEDVKADAISLQSINEAVSDSKASVSLVILDACRDNPFAKKATRSTGGTRGLSVVSGTATSGSAVMFATSPGDVAQDGTGRNGIFTAALLKYIEDDTKIEDLFKKVTGEVRKLSGGSQNPWLNVSLSNDYYLVADSLRAARAAETARAAEAILQADLAKAAELARAAMEAEVAKAATAAAAAEKANTDAARLEAATAKQDAARAMEAVAKAEAAARAALAAVEAQASAKNGPRGKIRIESYALGEVYLGNELLGTVASDSPLVADTLPVGNQDFRFVSLQTGEETKTVGITDKAYSTLIFGLALRKDTLDPTVDWRAIEASISVKLRTMNPTQLLTVDPVDLGIPSLPEENRTRLYQNLRHQGAFGAMMGNLIPGVGLGSFLQGDWGYSVYAVSSLGASIGTIAWVSSIQNNKDLGPFGLLFWAAQFNLFGSYIGGFIVPWVYEGDQNKALSTTLLLSTK